MTDNDLFYANLIAFDQFSGICAAQNYVELPSDWVILISDIKGSTKAIQNGHYRQVNSVGVASIIAVINALNPIAIPYVFGGDGATLCIPRNHLDKAKQALIASSNLAKSQFELILRVGAVPHSVIKQAGFQVLIAKCKVSEGYFQAAFSGEGLVYAEKLVKSDTNNAYCFETIDSIGKADFTGFECRWKDIPSPKDETVSILVMATNSTIEDSNLIYSATLKKILNIYGNENDFRPVQTRSLRLATDRSDLSNEISIRTNQLGKISRIFYILTLPLKVLLGQYWMNNGKKALGVDWGKYKDTLVANTDFRKFDDTLRMVISGNESQRIALDQYLQKQYKQRVLVYGIHKSSAALMTCVISDYNKDHVHFVDGADGGYAMAAKALKLRLKQQKSVIP